MEVWLLEFAQGVGRLFLQPFLYVFLLCTVTVGYYRVKKERKNFSVRVHDVLYELRTLLGMSIGLGLLGSLVTVGLGFTVPMNVILLVAIGATMFSLLFLFRFASSVYLIPLAAAIVWFLEGKESSFIGIHLGASFSILSLAVIVGLLLVAEACLVAGKWKDLSSPVTMVGKRGKKIGMHMVNRLWLVPLFLLVPMGEISSFANWWPIAPLGGSGYGLFLIPFPIGFVQQIRGMVPKQYLAGMVRQIAMLAIVVLLLASVSYWISWLGYVALGVAVLGRALIDIRATNIDRQQPLYFSQKDKGLLVLGVVPASPAHKMGIEVGELVTKVNGRIIASPEEYYQALQKNLAFCKLEVVDANGEPRLVQRALYQGEHYELGILHLHNNEELDKQYVTK